MRSALCLAALLAGAGAAHAEQVVFYRCTDAHDNLTVQNQPCPKGMRQQKKIMQGVGRAPAQGPATAPVAPAAQVPVPAAVRVAAPPDPPTAPTPPANAAPRLPPPPLYACTTYARQRYIGEVAEPAPRCVPLRTMALDGSLDRTGGSACEVLRDRCEALPEAGACDAWKTYVAEAETHWRFATPEDAEPLRQEFLRRQQLLQASSCGAPD
ncbi:DUF4124 domain-containing protein [Xanthomonas translucens]|uniref:DUF4124 domain-containing protein n=1 Tax=Xanthomonas campestris pv. translucens TaxID=343 RepID=UPI0019D6EA98|nr:DUF4124 domain-containing protein [Xanthomonas translucens]QSQ52849.1 DUF4124 domain-containing protein [Xanthomonas translucens pv. undulosa]QSQ61541.1 DUF4124 domain-containing protein [Xanthomonas translucens pv. undulosa]UPU49084.1 DUF4124 domain-containing protein [Xanthomonas translucens pv. undulosa]